MWTQNIGGPEFVIGMDYYELCFFAILIPFLNIRKVPHQFMWSVSYLYNPGRYFKTYVYLQIRFPVVQKLDCIFFYDERWGGSFVNKRNNQFLRKYWIKSPFFFKFWMELKAYIFSHVLHVKILMKWAPFKWLMKNHLSMFLVLKFMCDNYYLYNHCLLNYCFLILLNFHSLAAFYTLQFKFVPPYLDEYVITGSDWIFEKYFDNFLGIDFWKILDK